MGNPLRSLKCYGIIQEFDRQHRYFVKFLKSLVRRRDAG
jgi:hypothetical protein